MPLVFSQGSYTWKGYIPARHRERLALSNYIQKSLPCRSPERAERLAKYLDGAWPGFVQLLDDTTDLTKTEIEELKRNFPRLVDRGRRIRAVSTAASISMTISSPQDWPRSSAVLPSRRQVRWQACPYLRLLRPLAMTFSLPD